MTNARLGYGVKLFMSDGASPDTFTEIAEIKTLDDSDSVDEVEVTNHQSPGSRREYIAGLISGDQIQFTVNYDPDGATHGTATGLRGVIGSTRTFRLEEPGNTTGMQFAAVVLSCSRSYPVDNVMEMQVTLRKSGAISNYTVS